MSSRAPAALPQPLDRPVPARRWTRGAWVALVLGALVEAAACALIAWFIAFGNATTCGDPAGAAEVRSGELAALVALGVALVPWAIGVAVTPFRGRLAAGALVAVSPLLLLMAAGLDPDFWVGGFCF